MKLEIFKTYETVEEQIKVLQELEKIGYLWRTKHKPTEYVPLEIDSNDKVIYLDSTDKRLSCGELQYLLKHDVDKITYEELKRKNKKVIL